MFVIDADLCVYMRKTIDIIEVERIGEAVYLMQHRWSVIDIKMSLLLLLLMTSEISCFQLIHEPLH